MKLLFRNTSLSRKFFRVKRKLRNIVKYSIAHSPFRYTGDKQILFLVGCQCSGSTLIARIFDGDYRTTVLGEDSCITGIGKDRLRIKTVTEIMPILDKIRFLLIIAVPKVESQRISYLLDSIPKLKAIWIYRNYKDVVYSKLNKFQRQIEDLKCIAEKESCNWRSDRVSSKTLEIVKTFYHEEMSKQDAAALMWYARNILFFEQNLQDNDRIVQIKYEELVENPSKEMKRLYNFLEIPYPGDKIVSLVDNKSLGLGKEVEIFPEIEDLCRGLMNRLESVRMIQNP